MNNEQNINLPEEIANKFNWGAFFLTWIWGLGNKSFITLTKLIAYIICLIPIIGAILYLPLSLGLGIWFGIKGNTWAWENKQWYSIEHFNNVQKNGL